VKINEKWGFINKRGKVAIAPQFDAALPFFGGLAQLYLGANLIEWLKYS
jgi:hypothetical protein